MIDEKYAFLDEGGEPAKVVIPESIEIPYEEERLVKTPLSLALDENGYVTQFCTGGYLGGETIHFDIDELPEDFYNLWQAYKVVDNALVLDTSKIAEVEDAKELDELRARREEECFSVINRGKLWYDRLTDEQYKELSDWYNAWLNVTEKKRGTKGFNIPTKPKWLT